MGRVVLHLLILFSVVYTTHAGCTGFGATACANGGSCNAAANVCECPAIWTGADCSTPEVLTVTAGSAVNEDAGTVSFTVTRTASFASLVVTLTAAGTGANPATSTSDFIFASPSLTFATGETSKSVDVTIIDDDDHEADEELTLTVERPAGSSIVSKTQTATINDNDVEVLTVTGGGTVIEDAGTVSFTVTRTASYASLVVTLTAVGTGANPATSTSDFTSIPSVAFGIGETSKSFDVVITDDGDPELSETFKIEFSNVNISPVDAQVTIDDNDKLHITSGIASSVTEGDSPIAFSGVAFSIPSGGSAQVPVTVTVTGVTAGSTDYTVTPSDTVTFTYDDSDPTSRAALDAMSITILDDSIAEPDKTFTITFTSDYQLSGDTDVTVTLEDDEIDTLTVSGGGSVDETSGLVMFSVTRTILFEELVVTVSTAPSGARPIQADDITAIAALTVTFAVGSATVGIPVTIVDDSVPEHDEEFTLTVVPPLPIAQVTATVTITNDDPVALTATSLLYANEDDGTATVTLSRSLAGGAVDVQVTTTDGTATAGTDYVALASQAVTFAAGSSTTTFSITITDDTDIEDEETFTFSVTGAGFTALSGQTFTIVENDGEGAIIKWEPSVQEFDCRRKNQNCHAATDECVPHLPSCTCVGGEAREGKMCNVITGQKDGAACAGKDCNNNGVCLDNTGVTSCACNPGYYGDDCEHYFLQAGCTKESITLFANPHGNFIGKIYVKGKESEADCTAVAVPDPVVSGDDIDDTLEGFYLAVDNDNADCGVITPVEGATESKYSRDIIIQYDPLIETGLDQSITVSCAFDNTQQVKAEISSVDDGQLNEGSASSKFTPLTMAVDLNGSPVLNSQVVPLAKKLCVTLTIPEDFGGLEISDIEFNNTLDADPKKWKVFTTGCPEDDTESVFITKPYYPTSSIKRNVKFCFSAFKFTDSTQLTVTVDVKICVDPTDCDQTQSCSSRRKRQATSSRAETVGTTFYIAEDETQTEQQSEDNRVEDVVATVAKDCSLRMEFIPTVVALCVIILLLVICVLVLTCKLARRSRKKVEENNHARAEHHHMHAKPGHHAGPQHTRGYYR